MDRFLALTESRHPKHSDKHRHMSALQGWFVVQSVDFFIKMRLLAVTF